MQLRLATVTLAALAASAYAQLPSELGNLSTGCQSAATSLISSDFASCANLIGLVQIFSASGSIVNPVNSWLQGVCPQTCSDSTIAQAGQTVRSGCSSDISSGNVVATSLTQVISNFKGYQSAFCLQSTSNSSYCVTNLLTDVQNASGSQISISFLTSLFSGNLFSGLGSSVAPSTVCTDCTHALVSKLTPVVNNGTTTSSTQSANSAVASTCGQSFVDGQIPSSVKETAAGASASAGASSGSNKGGAVALSFSAVAPAVGVVGAVLGGLVLFA